MTGPAAERPADEGGRATPGPWESRTFDESQTVIYGPEYDGGKHELIAVVSVGRHRPHGEGNVALIAAAPDLFEALKLHVGKNSHTAGCTAVTQLGYPCSKRCRLTRAALASALPPSDREVTG